MGQLDRSLCHWRLWYLVKIFSFFFFFFFFFIFTLNSGTNYFISDILRFTLRSEKTKIGSTLSGALVSTLVGLAASNLGILSSQAPAYAIVLEFLLPMAVPLLLFRADLRRVIQSTGTLLLAFLLGSGNVSHYCKLSFCLKLSVFFDSGIDNLVVLCTEKSTVLPNGRVPAFIHLERMCKKKKK